MVELEAIVSDLCARLPCAIGAVLCDFEGEAVCCALGSADAPAEAEKRAREHVPRTLELTMPVAEFLIRLAGAEPCGLLRMFEASSEKHGTGHLCSLEMRYGEVEMLVKKLPNDFYLVLVLRRPAISAEARRLVVEAGARLAEYVS
jgi:hypothetical protein